MSSDNDRLRRLFVAAHIEDEPAPEFQRFVAQRSQVSPVRRNRWLAVTAAVAVVLATLVPLVEWRRERQALEFARELATWRAPTDSLLVEPYGGSALFDEIGRSSILGATNDMVRWRN